MQQHTDGPQAGAAQPAAGRTRPSPRAVRLFVSCLLTWLIPYAFFSLFLSFAELQPPYSSIPIFHPLVVAYVLGFGAAAAGWITRRYLALMRQDAGGADVQVIRRGVRGVLFRLPVIVVSYLAFGTAATLLLAVNTEPGVAMNWSGSDLLVSALGSLVVAAYILLPLGLVCLDEFGTALGHVLEDEPLVSIWLRTSPGLMMVVMIGTAMVLQEYIRLGQLDRAPLLLMLTMIPYAVIAMLLNMRYTSNALNSVDAYLAAARHGQSISELEIRPESLDKIGVMVYRVGDLVGKLQASEARLRGFADAASDFYFESDADTRIVWASERLEEVTGLRREDVLGRSFRGLAEALGLEAPRETVELLRMHRAFRDLLITLPGENGATRSLRISGVPILDSHGAFSGYRGVGTDVSGIVRAEERLREREQQLAQAQKMEAVGQLRGAWRRTSTISC